MQRTFCSIVPPNISLLGGLYLETALKYKVKQSKNSKFHPNYKVSPIDFEMQISHVDKPHQI